MRATYAIGIALAACQNTAAIGLLSLASAKNYAAAGWSIAKQVEVPPAISGAATNVGQYAMEKAGDGASWAAENPASAACAAVAVGGLAIFAAPTIAMSPMLAVAGFGPNGPVAGGIAAGIQSVIGNVAAGGLFATCQSAAMGGAGAATVATVAQGVGLGVAAAGGAAAAKWRSE